MNRRPPPGMTALAALATLALTPAAAQERSAWADTATRELVRAAQARHRTMGEDLPGYRADVLTRSVGTIGATRWAPDYTLVQHEMLSAVQWHRPNDLRIDVRGMRNRSFRLPGVSARDVAGFWTETLAGEPWFAARYLGDNIEIIGVPDRPARHPLAPDGERWYRYAIADSAVLELGDRTVHAIAVEVRPRAQAPFPLLTGQIWLDRASLDLVRLIGALDGPGMWEDDEPESPLLVGLELDLEYGLHEGRWWLPRRQIVTTHWTYRYLPGAALSATATTTFSGHQVLAEDSTIAFRTTRDQRRGRWGVWTCDIGYGAPRCGSEGLVRSRHRRDGSWEVVIPPLDTILAFPFDSAFAVHEDLQDEEALTERLIAMSTWSAAVPSANRLRTVDLTPFEAFGFDRVRGPSVGGGGMLRLAGSWHLRGTARGALHEPFWTGEAGLHREDASGRLDLVARRHLATVEPWTPDGGLGPALRALFLGHDDADWYLAEGAALSWRGYRGSTRGFRARIAVERHRSVTAASRSAPHDVLFGDGDFQPNPPVADGWTAHVSAERDFEILAVGADALTGAHGLGARAWARGRYGPVRALVGTAAGDVTPQQEFRLGGPSTIRGATYGVRRGRRVWAVQADLPIWAGPFVRVIPFGDLAGTWTADDPAVGIGFGVADSEGYVRLDVAFALRPERTTRFDIRLALPR